MKNGTNALNVLIDASLMQYFDLYCRLTGRTKKFYIHNYLYNTLPAALVKVMRDQGLAVPVDLDEFAQKNPDMNKIYSSRDYNDSLTFNLPSVSNLTDVMEKPKTRHALAEERRLAKIQEEIDREAETQQFILDSTEEIRLRVEREKKEAQRRYIENMPESLRINIGFKLGQIKNNVTDNSYSFAEKEFYIKSLVEPCEFEDDEVQFNRLADEDQDYLEADSVYMYNLRKAVIEGLQPLPMDQIIERRMRVKYWFDLNEHPYKVRNTKKIPFPRKEKK